MAKQEDEEEDYMGDLSLFLPEPSHLTKNLKQQNKSNSKLETLPHQPSTKKSKLLHRKQQQREEDEKTLVNIESPIPQSNVGFKMLKKMGYKPGSALGKDGSGQAEPVGLEIRRSRAGVGREDPVKEKIRRDLARVEREKREEESLLVEFESRKKTEWRIKRVCYNYRKAKLSLEQLENKEIVEVERKDDESGEEEEEEEEEEEITEEDLHEILMKLRDEHHYCFFCGCKYESMEALLSNCPGVDEDDH